jgi:hypothetical protein
MSAFEGDEAAMWEFADQHALVTLFIVAILATAAASPFFFAFLAYNQTLRSRNIVAQGWPPAHLDADGDLVTEEADEKPDPPKSP